MSSCVVRSRRLAQAAHGQRAGCCSERSGTRSTLWVMCTRGCPSAGVRGVEILVFVQCSKGESLSVGSDRPLGAICSLFSRHAGCFCFSKTYRSRYCQRRCIQAPHSPHVLCALPALSRTAACPIHRSALTAPHSRPPAWPARGRPAVLRSPAALEPPGVLCQRAALPCPLVAGRPVVQCC